MDARIKFAAYADYIATLGLNQHVLDLYADRFGALKTLEFNASGAQAGTSALNGLTIQQHLQSADVRAQHAFDNVTNNPLFQLMVDIRLEVAANDGDPYGDVSRRIVDEIPHASLLRFPLDGAGKPEVLWDDDVRGMVLANQVFSGANGNDPNAFYDIVKTQDYADFRTEISTLLSDPNIYPDPDKKPLLFKDFVATVIDSYRDRRLDAEAGETVERLFEKARALDPDVIAKVDADTGGRLSQALADLETVSDKIQDSDLHGRLATNIIALVFGLIGTHASYKIDTESEPEKPFEDWLAEQAPEFIAYAPAIVLGGALTAGGFYALAAAAPFGATAAIVLGAAFTFIELKALAEQLNQAYADEPDSWTYTLSSAALAFMGAVETILPIHYFEGLMSVAAALFTPIQEKLVPAIKHATGENTPVVGEQNAWLIGEDATSLFGSNANNVIAQYYGYGEVHGYEGSDWLFTYKPRGLAAGELIGDPPAAGEPDDRRPTIADMRARLWGGDDNDVLMSVAISSDPEDPTGAELYGGEGDDILIGFAERDTLVGGEGSDRFILSFTTTVVDATPEDSIYLGPFKLSGGLQSWWMEGPWAVWAPGTAAASAIQNFIPNVLITGAFGPSLILMGLGLDFFSANLVQYAKTDDGALVVQFAWMPESHSRIEGWEQNFEDRAADGGLLIYKEYTSRDPYDGYREDLLQVAIKVAFGSAAGKDPLALDLDGDGLELGRLRESSVYFDLDADGFAERAAWVKPDDGLLARDLNGDGLINDATELFGDADTPGFAALAALDSNADGVIDAADAEFAALRVWRDLDGDGATDPGELQTLTEAEIASIDLAAAPGDGAAIRGNDLREISHFTRADGSAGDIAEALLETDEADALYLGDPTLSPEAAALPTLKGSGTAPDLRVAMTADAALLALVDDLATQPAATDWTSIRAATETILLRWAGADATAQTPLGDGAIRLDQLAALETFFGRPLAARDASDQPIVQPAARLDETWSALLDQSALRLAAQGPWSAAFSAVSFDPVADRFGSPAADALAQVIEAALNDLPADPAAADAAWAQSWAPAIAALANALRRPNGTPVRDDYLVQSLVRAEAMAPPPLDLAQLTAGLQLDAVQIGSAGDDALTRDGGDRNTQTFVGGAGDDTMTGGWGQDVYVFAGQWGQDRVLDDDPVRSGDRLRFADRTADELTFSRAGQDLVVASPDGDSVTVVDHFAAPFSTGVANGREPAQGVEEIQFADGEVWSQGQVAAAVGRGSAAAETLDGTKREDILEGAGGDDTLKGGDGGDIYVYRDGDGADRIEEVRADLFLKTADALILPDLDPESLTLSRSDAGAGDDLILTFADGGSITLVDQAFYDPISYGDYDLDRRVEAVIFNGPTWSWADLQQQTIASYTSEGDDLTTGFGTPDQFASSPGDDTLRGLDGGDSYEIRRGAGADLIEDASRYVNPPMASLIGVDWRTGDSIEFADDIAVADVTFTRLGPDPDLTITIAGEADPITVKGQFDGLKLDLLGLLGIAWFDRIETFNFADGTTLSWQDVLADVTTGDAGDNALYGAYYQDTLDGKEGNDTLSGGDEGDLYLFGIGYGADVIEDNQTNVLTQTPDTLRFGAGIAVADVTFARDGRTDDLTATLAGAPDTLRVVGQYDVLETGAFGAQAFDQIERFEWADGAVKTWATLRQEIIAAAATAGDDLVVGSHYDDTLTGGAGADTLEGENGSDLYQWGAGDGDDRILDHWSNVLADTQDRVAFTGLNAADLALERAGDDLVFRIAATDETLTIENQFAYGPLPNVREYEIESFQFADGTVWSNAELKAAYLTQAATAGDDLLTGFQFSDTLTGGAGNDTLQGGDGSDTYVFEAGFGQDRIEETRVFAAYPEQDVVEFGAGLTAALIQLSATGDDLTVTFQGHTDSLTIAGQFDSFGYQGAWSDIDRFRFADGTEWTAARIASETLAQAATAGDDLITGFFTADRLDGGAGNDTLRGSTGGDSYVFGAGSGQDVIQENIQDHIAFDGPDQILFGPGLTLADVTFARVGDDMVISIDATTDQLTIEDHYAAVENRVELFKFEDGTTLTALAATGEAIASAATPGDDLIQGGNGADMLDGGAGDDTLQGSTGGDRYLFGRGAGVDRIEELDITANGLDDPDAVIFGDDLTLADVTFARIGDELRITIDATADQLTIADHYGPAKHRVEQFIFADGTQLSALQATDQALKAAATAGDDTLLGGSGADLLDGGAGDDVLRGSTGGDAYLFGRGSGDDRIEELDTTANGLDDPDAVRFAAGLAREDVAFRRQGDDLRITIADAADALTITDHFKTEIARVERFEFADGAALTRAQAEAAAVAAQETPGDDAVLGSNGADAITGGLGNDTLQGEDGDDAYIFELGDGQDVIEESASNFGIDETDALLLGEGIAQEDVTLARSANGRDLIVSINGTSDQITIRDNFKTEAYFGSWTDIERIDFAAGESWSAARIRAILLDQAATSGDDQIDGFWTPDTLTGGAGDDTLAGSTGGDLYLYELGDGRDAIVEARDHHPFLDGDDAVQFGESVDIDDLRYFREGADLVLRFASAPDDELRVVDQFNAANDQTTKVEYFAFATGERLAKEEVMRRVIDAQATPGDDVVRGYVLADALDGYAGDDTLIGEDGGDAYHWGRGAGDDLIDDDGYSDGDRVIFSADIAPTDLTVLRQGDDAILTLADSPDDRLTIANQFGTVGDRIESFEFADGTVWTHGDLEQSGGDGTEAADNLLGGSGDDLLRGFGGDDTIDGADGNDTLYGGVDHDSLQGQNGDDLLYGEGGRDTLIGWYGDDTLYGGSGGDDLEGGSNADILYGQNGDDHLVGKTGNDSLQGDDGADTLEGGDGVDTLLGGDGDDWLNGGNDFDTLDGGAGEDTADYSFSSFAADFDLTAETATFGAGVEPLISIEHLIGAQSANRIDGSDVANLLDGQAGNDAIYGHGADDTLIAGDGVDLLFGGDGDDWLHGGTGLDAFDGGAGADTVVLDYTDIAATIDLTAQSITFVTSFAEALTSIENAVGTLGDDTLIGDAGANRLAGADGADSIEGGAGADTLSGDKGNDLLIGGDDVDVGDGGAGRDTLYGDGGDDTLAGGDNNDTLYGGANNDLLTGGLGADQLRGGGGQNVLLGVEDDDILIGGGSNDTLDGGAGVDVAKYSDRDAAVIVDLRIAVNQQTGGAGNDLLISIENLIGTDFDDTLTGDAAANSLDGNSGADILDGQGGADSLDGDHGADTLIGGRGDDKLTGAGGADLFQFTGGDGADTILDFEDGTDLIQVSGGLTFADLTLSQDGADALIDYGATDQIRLTGASAANLTETDFIFTS